VCIYTEYALVCMCVRVYIYTHCVRVYIHTHTRQVQAENVLVCMCVCVLVCMCVCVQDTSRLCAGLYVCDYIHTHMPGTSRVCADSGAAGSILGLF